MPSMKEKIYQNLITYADFSSAAVDGVLASEIANALRANTSVTSIDFQCSNLNDVNFAIIAEAIKDRKIPLSDLNLDLTKLTSKSLDVVKELIQAGLVSNIFMYRLRNVYTNNSLQEEFSNFAKKFDKVTVSFSHPDERPKQTFFEKNHDELKEAYVNVQFSKEEKESTVAVKKNNV